jgi:hypothetical protein
MHAERYPELTAEEVQTAYKVLEIVREDYNEAGMVSEEQCVNNAHVLVQEFDAGTSWIDAGED